MLNGYEDLDIVGDELDTGKIRGWRSIITLIVFVITSESAQRPRAMFMAQID